MSELQDALDRWDSERSEDVIRRIRSDSDDVELFVEAARLVANLHGAIVPHQLNDALKFAHITDSDGDYLIYVAQRVARFVFPDPRPPDPPTPPPGRSQG